MPKKLPADSGMGDIVGSTRQRLEAQTADPAERLRAHVAGSTPPFPANYFQQVPPEGVVTPKRKPQRGPARTLHISMRLSPPERTRFVEWCEARNLSLPDGLIALLDLAEVTEK